jgi:hypothetical protein
MKLPDQLKALAEVAGQLPTPQQAVETLAWAIDRSEGHSLDGEQAVQARRCILGLAEEIRQLHAEVNRFRRIVGSVCQSARHVSVREVTAGPVWGVISYLCGLGSTSSIALCREFEVDPHEKTDEVTDGDTDE